MFFNSLNSVGRTLTVGVIAYVILVFFLRISGKRTLTKLNAFDLVVTVALGSTLASIITSQQVALASGTAALGLLIALQLVVTWIVVRVPWFAHLIKAAPTVVYYDGHFLDQHMKSQRVTRNDVFEAVRKGGLSSMEQVEAVVLESDGSISVLKPGKGEPIPPLKGYEEKKGG